MALISFRDLGMVTPRPIFQNITFSFGPGDRVGIVTANGAGKSTLLRCVAGQIDLDEGNVMLSRGARLGFVEQEIPASLLRLTLKEALRRALPPADREHESWRVSAVLDEFGLPTAWVTVPSAHSVGVGSGLPFWPASGSRSPTLCLWTSQLTISTLTGSPC